MSKANPNSMAKVGTVYKRKPSNPSYNPHYEHIRVTGLYTPQYEDLVVESLLDVNYVFPVDVGYLEEFYDVDYAYMAVEEFESDLGDLLDD
jgi:hypothetical protein